MRERAATGAFLAQFYMGIENVLKRITKYHDVEIPSSPRWHVDLFELFCKPIRHPFAAVEESRIGEFDAFRRFRHVAHHAYGFDFKWEQMSEGIERVRPAFAYFEKRVLDHVATVQ